MKKIKILTALLSIMLLISFNEKIQATPGMLRTNSVEKCGKTYYARHTTHYHQAKKSGARWYPVSTNTTYKRIKRCHYVQNNGSAGSTKKVTNTKLQSVKLKKCVDGDTAQFSKVGRSRFLMIDTPEKNTKYGKIAAKYTCNQLKKAKKIQVRYDSRANKTDRYNRSLVWVYVDGSLLQSRIAKKGYVSKYYTSKGKATKRYQNVKLTSKYVNQVSRNLKKHKQVWHKSRV
ncbi:thermonuclease family protein [Mycoplasma sp. P36-A1]|uniref:thermonuclease family protein n=1 Tax=Mycoplasma sp. P36-A1 TaxID=3252900 RepID=UPI003C2E7DC0